MPNSLSMKTHPLDPQVFNEQENDFSGIERVKNIFFPEEETSAATTNIDIIGKLQALSTQDIFSYLDIVNDQKIIDQWLEYMAEDKEFYHNLSPHIFKRLGLIENNFEALEPEYIFKTIVLIRELKSSDKITKKLKGRLFQNEIDLHCRFLEELCILHPKTVQLVSDISSAKILSPQPILRVDKKQEKIALEIAKITNNPHRITKTPTILFFESVDLADKISKKLNPWNNVQRQLLRKIYRLVVDENKEFTPEVFRKRINFVLYYSHQVNNQTIARACGQLCKKMVEWYKLKLSNKKVDQG